MLDKIVQKFDVREMREVFIDKVAMPTMDVILRSIVVALDWYMTDVYNNHTPAEIRNPKYISKVTSSEIKLKERGVIFPTLQALEEALKLYDRGYSPSSRREEDRYFRDRWREANPNKGVDDPNIFRQTPEALMTTAMVGSLQNKDKLVNKIIEDIRNSGGSYRREFKYDAFCTPFFKIGVSYKEIDGKHVLSLGKPVSDYEQEKELAKVLGKDRALEEIKLRYSLSKLRIDTDRECAGVNMDSLFGGLFGRKNISRVGSSVVYPSFDWHVDKFKAQVGGLPVNIYFTLSQEGNYSKHVRKISNMLFLETKGDGQPYMGISLIPQRRIVDLEQRDKFTQLADGLHSRIMEYMS